MEMNSEQQSSWRWRSRRWPESPERMEMGRAVPYHLHSSPASRRRSPVASRRRFRVRKPADLGFGRGRRARPERTSGGGHVSGRRGRRARPERAYGGGRVPSEKGEKGDGGHVSRRRGRRARPMEKMAAAASGGETATVASDREGRRRPHREEEARTSLFPRDSEPPSSEGFGTDLHWPKGYRGIRGPNSAFQFYVKPNGGKRGKRGPNSRSANSEPNSVHPNTV